MTQELQDIINQVNNGLKSKSTAESWFSRQRNLMRKGIDIARKEISPYAKWSLVEGRLTIVQIFRDGVAI